MSAIAFMVTPVRPKVRCIPPVEGVLSAIRVLPGTGCSAGNEKMPLALRELRASRPGTVQGIWLVAAPAPCCWMFITGQFIGPWGLKQSPNGPYSESAKARLNPRMGYKGFFRGRYNRSPHE